MASRRWVSIIVGLLLLIFGTVFALQGANVIRGSALMSGNPTYIYVGGALTVVGLIVIIVGLMHKSKATPTSTSTGPVRSAT